MIEAANLHILPLVLFHFLFKSNKDTCNLYVPYFISIIIANVCVHEDDELKPVSLLLPLGVRSVFGWQLFERNMQQTLVFTTKAQIQRDDPVLF
jgi:hypothetical protein